MKDSSPNVPLTQQKWRLEGRRPSLTSPRRGFLAREARGKTWYLSQEKHNRGTETRDLRTLKRKRSLREKEEARRNERRQGSEHLSSSDGNGNDWEEGVNPRL